MGYIVGFGMVYFVINLIIAVFMEAAADKKGYDATAHAFGICICFGLVGCLYVVALPDLVARENQNKIIELLGVSTGKIIEEDNDDELPEL